MDQNFLRSSADLYTAFILSNASISLTGLCQTSLHIALKATYNIIKQYNFIKAPKFQFELSGSFSCTVSVLKRNKPNFTISALKNVKLQFELSRSFSFTISSLKNKPSFTISASKHNSFSSQKVKNVPF